LLIAISLLSSRLPRGDEANSFSFAVFSNRVDYQKDCDAASETECMPARFSRRVGAVLLEKRIRILKDMHCVFKAHGVFLEVNSRFHRVPLE
jgi:hypothetical protein